LYHDINDSIVQLEEPFKVFADNIVIDTEKK